ncbi:MAG TPA: ParB N-terminal domain-containing protein [Anaerolineales bacterium]|nr:ParB N-terminal domain-containing protein [Anaerolineales bacterium]
MKGLPDLPELRIVPADALRPHEHADERRTGPLAQALRADGVLRNPPVVLPLGTKPERYVVLDGANRTSAFRRLGLRDVVAQVVHPDDSRVQVETWNHVVLDVAPGELRSRLEENPELALVPSDGERAAYALSAGGTLAYLATIDDVFEVVCETEPLDVRLNNLHRLVASYLERGRVERSRARSARELNGVFPAFGGLFVFQGFEVEDVVAAAAQGRLLPSGLTRFIVSPRALRLNYPLERLEAQVDPDAKQRELEAWVRERVEQRRVRYYAEATFLFDE